METIELNKTSQIFFRARIHEEYEIYPRKEMFHVPLDRKNIISNQRYSINGFPCLYLGASLYDCWEELRRADLEKLNFVGYRYVKARPLRFLLIDYRVKFDSADTCIKRIILFLLCTWIVSDDRKKFKFEYVIPELILHALISYNNQQTNMLEKYDGIAYISSRFFKPNCMYKNNHNKMMNYVIPIKSSSANKTKYCDTLIDMFELSEVNAMFNNTTRGKSYGMNISRPTAYEFSIFRQLEREIEKSQYQKIENSNI